MQTNQIKDLIWKEKITHNWGLDQEINNNGNTRASISVDELLKVIRWEISRIDINPSEIDFKLPLKSELVEILYKNEKIGEVAKNEIADLLE